MFYKGKLSDSGCSPTDKKIVLIYTLSMVFYQPAALLFNNERTYYASPSRESRISYRSSQLPARPTGYAKKARYVPTSSTLAPLLILASTSGLGLPSPSFPRYLRFVERTTREEGRSEEPSDVLHDRRSHLEPYPRSLRGNYTVNHHRTRPHLPRHRPTVRN